MSCSAHREVNKKEDSLHDGKNFVSIYFINLRVELGLVKERRGLNPSSKLYIKVSRSALGKGGEV